MMSYRYMYPDNHGRSLVATYVVPVVYFLALHAIAAWRRTLLSVKQVKG